MADRFDARTSVAIRYVASDRFADTWPPKLAGDQFKGSCSAWVTGGRVIMVSLDNSGEKAFVVGDVDETVDHQEAIFEFAF